MLKEITNVKLEEDLTEFHGEIEKGKNDYKIILKRYR